MWRAVTPQYPLVRPPAAPLAEGERIINAPIAVFLSRQSVGFSANPKTPTSGCQQEAADEYAAQHLQHLTDHRQLLAKVDSVLGRQPEQLAAANNFSVVCSDALSAPRPSAMSGLRAFALKVDQK